MRDKTDGKYHIKGVIYEKIRGTREQHIKQQEN